MSTFGYGIAFFVGLVLTVAMLWMGYRSYRVTGSFQKTEAVITRAWIETGQSGRDGNHRPYWQVRAEYRYVVDGIPYSSEMPHTGELRNESEATSAMESATGETFQVWYDPDDPDDSEAEPGSPSVAWMSLFGVFFMVFSFVRGRRAWRDPRGQPLPEA